MSFESKPEDHLSLRQSNPSLRRLFVLFSALVAIASILSIFYVSRYWMVPSAEELITQAKLTLDSGDYETAGSLAKQALTHEPAKSEAALIAAQAAYHQQLFDECDRLLKLLESNNNLDTTSSLLSAGELWLIRGRHMSAEEAFREVLELDPNSVIALQQLAWMLRVQGRNWELRSIALRLMEQGEFSRDLLFPLTVPDRIWLDPREYEYLKSLGSTLEPDWMVLLGPAVHESQTRISEESGSFFRLIALKHPHLIAIQVQLGTYLLNHGEAQEFLDWHAQLPHSADQFPEIWNLRGMWFLSQQQPEQSARCFFEAIQRDPNHLSACYQLSQILVTSNDPEHAEFFSQRAQRLSDLKQIVISNLNRQTTLSPETIFSIISNLQSLGRNWEAAGWLQTAISQFGPSSDLKILQAKLPKTLSTQETLTSKQYKLMLQIDLRLPEWDRSLLRQTDSTSHSPLSSPINGKIQFFDHAETANLKFKYQNGADPKNGHVAVYHFSGGGVGVLDYDLDGWPDLCLTQGSMEPTTTNRGEHIDRIFRNQGGHSFQDVTEKVRVRESSYSQGVAVGDFNSDGFPDLYIANIGRNSLFRNNGDGTFTDVTSDAGLYDNMWTISCTIADLNGDAFPEIYDVNYLSGDDVLTRRCDSFGTPIQCPVDQFASETDRLFLNRGHGNFEDISEMSGVAHHKGKGMGIVAGDFDESGRISLFIANDTTANSFLVNITAENGKVPRFDERGLISGIAYGEDGSLQSCMGIAAGNADSDGRPDLMVTNFLLEPNNLYMLESSGLFKDRAASFQLQTSSRKLMGWGTQFLDGDLDGFEDLIVANGHLDRTTARESQYRMPTQYFKNVNGQRFHEVNTASLGPYFEHPHAGRAVARLDWNRDGLPDVCITHEDSPVALLTNSSSEHGDYLSIRLVGTESNREAISAKLQLSSETHVWHKQLLAGDGFQSSNERRILFGLGATSSDLDLVVQWPSGKLQSFPGISANQEIWIVEGQDIYFSPTQCLPSGR